MKNLFYLCAIKVHNQKTFTMTQVYIVATNQWVESLGTVIKFPLAAFESKSDAEAFIERFNKNTTNENISFGFFDPFQKPIPFTPATVTAQQFNEMYMGKFKVPPTFDYKFVGGTSNLPVIEVTLKHFVDEIDSAPLVWVGTGASKRVAKQEAINLSMKYFENIFK
jgi:hypothetical protein